MNTVTLIGTLTRDPEFQSSEQTVLCRLRVAERNSYKDSKLFVDVSAFGRQAEVCQEHLSKGQHVAITGRLRFREWENDEGKKRSELSIVAVAIDFLPSSKKTLDPDPRDGHEAATAVPPGA